MCVCVRVCMYTHTNTHIHTHTHTHTHIYIYRWRVEFSADGYTYRNFILNITQDRHPSAVDKVLHELGVSQRKVRASTHQELRYAQVSRSFSCDITILLSLFYFYSSTRSL